MTRSDRSADLRAGAEAAAAALPALLLAADRLARGVDPGAHGQRRAGAGDEFWQFRPAQRGDAAAAIDWRRSARSDTAFVREREAQSPRAAVLWVAATPGMAWSGDPARPTKRDRALLLALALGLLLLRGGERVALAGQPSKGGRTQAETLGRDLLDVTGNDLPAEAALRPGQRLVLIGDFLAGTDRLAALLQRLSALGGGGVLFQVLDPDEQTFPYAGALRLRAPGGPIRATSNAAALRGAYLQRLAARRAELAALAGQAGMRFGTHDTGAPPAEALAWLRGALSA